MIAMHKLLRRQLWHRYLLYLSCLIMPGMITPPAHAEIYTWKDAEGRIHFSDSKPQEYNANEVEVDVDNNVYSPVPIPETTFTPGEKKEIKKRTMRKAKRGEVIMYSTEWCGYCGRAKDYFRKKGIAYTEYDIEKSDKAKKEHTALGGGGVPVLLIGTKKGTRLMRGFSEQRFEAIYN
jgi:glutaredoxin